MHERFLDMLRCPACRGPLVLGPGEERSGETILEGELRCEACAKSFPIRNRIPRFVPDYGYTEAFSWQWNRFPHLQRDSYNGSTITRDLILRRTGWTPEHLAGKTVLECGCGSGNDTEVLTDLAGTVISVDLSDSVDAFAPEVLARKNLLVVQADLRFPPFEGRAFDVVYCHRVIMHTPDPHATFGVLASFVRPGGELFLHSYSTHWKSRLNYRYVWRPLTKRLPHALVFRTLQGIGPALYALHAVLHRIAFLRTFNRLVIPFDYHGKNLKRAGAKLTLRERYAYALLTTFDALTPAFDQPNSPETVRSWFREAGFTDLTTQRINPVCVTGRLPAEG